MHSKILQSALDDFSILENLTAEGPRDWTTYNLAQTQERQFLLKLTNELVDFCVEKEPDAMVGRPRTPIHDIIKSLVIKTYEEKSSRRTCGYVSGMHKAGYIGKDIHFNTLLLYLRSPTLTPTLQRMLEITAQFFRGTEEIIAIDSTGFSTTRFNGWLDKKFEKEKPRRSYVKFHAVVGTKTSIIAGLSVTPEHSADCKQFEVLARKAVECIRPHAILADKAYSSRANMNVSNELGIIPIIPFKVDATGKSLKSPTWHRMFEFYMTHRVFFRKIYNQRSNIESTFSSIKRKLTDSVRGKTIEGNVNELLLVALVHNICVVIKELVENGFTPSDVEGVFCADGLNCIKKAV